MTGRSPRIALAEVQAREEEQILARWRADAEERARRPVLEEIRDRA